MSAGGSKSTRSSSSTALRDSMGFQQSGSFVDPSQVGFLDVLRDTALQRQQNAYDFRNNNAAIAGQARQGVGNLLGLGNQTEIINQQLGSLRSGISDIFSQGLNSRRGDAYLSGAGGSARADLQETALAGELSQAFSQGVGDIYAGANQRAIAANQGAIAGSTPAQLAQTQAEFGDLSALQGLLGAPTVLNQSLGMDRSQSTAVSQAGSGSRSSSVGFK